MDAGAASRILLSQGATFVSAKNGVEWWRTRGGEWIAKRVVGQDVKLYKMPANACNC